MIFAAGFGTRMGALTQSLPKPMVPLAGRPMIDHTTDLLRAAGVTKIVANTHYLRDKIEPHLRAKGIVLSPEDPDILDTGGGLKAALPKLNSDVVLTINPDAVWIGKNPVSALLDAWRPDMTALLMLVPLSRADTIRETGDFSLEHGEIRRQGPYLYTGAQIIRTNRLSELHDKTFSLNAYWDLLFKTGPLNGVVYQGAWCDIGTPEGLSAAERMLVDV
jgi:MurNAc alpha-1-phosphate uridylyltransferase